MDGVQLQTAQAYDGKAKQRSSRMRARPLTAQPPSCRPQWPAPGTAGQPRHPQHPAPGREEVTKARRAVRRRRPRRSAAAATPARRGGRAPAAARRAGAGAQGSRFLTRRRRQAPLRGSIASRFNGSGHCQLLRRACRLRAGRAGNTPTDSCSRRAVQASATAGAIGECGG